MKNRKTIIVGFILVACMIVGVGYAAVTDNFVIDGQATISDQGALDAFNEDIRFEGIVITVDGEEQVVSDVLASQDLGYTASCNVPLDSASFHINDFKGQGQSKTIVFRIRNYGDLAAELTVAAAVEDEETDIFSIDCDLDAVTELPVGGYVDVKVTVTVDKSVVEQTSAEFTITFNAQNNT